MNFRILKISLLLLLFTFGTSCTRIFYKSNHSQKSYAPGQVKKRTGSKSAKPYAPGQQKKKRQNNPM